MSRMKRRDLSFPGDSECALGLVTTGDGYAHVCFNCEGRGCKPKLPNRGARARRRALLEDLSGSTVLTDQKGRTVFVDLERGRVYVAEGLS